MTPRKSVAALLGAASVAVPGAAIALAQEPREDIIDPLGSALGVETRFAESLPTAARRYERGQLLDRHVRLARRAARRDGERLGARYRERAAKWPSKTLRRKNRELKRLLAVPNVAVPAALASIAACESGGNPRAIGGGGAYRGKYQFDYGTWASVGGSGDPAAAPEAEQDARAAMLYARAGSSPWPVCG